MQPENKNDGVQLSTRYQQYCFAKQHLRGKPRPEVFPFGGEVETVDKALFIDESQWRREGKLREYQGTSPILNIVGGGGHLPLTAIIQKAKEVVGEDYHDLQTGGNAPTSEIIESSSLSSPTIRRLTPTECERLQGFPDGWTEGVSDTQRYKTLGNAVTVNVIQDIFKKIFVDN